jgi:hypothetical protein
LEEEDLGGITAIRKYAGFHPHRNALIWKSCLFSRDLAHGTAF